jgi:hypothetical protein
LAVVREPRPAPLRSCDLDSMPRVLIGAIDLPIERLGACYGRDLTEATRR